jgi:hypothetical protein
MHHKYDRSPHYTFDRSNTMPKITTATLMAGLYPLQSTPTTFMMDPYRVRDQLIVELQKRSEPFVTPFIRHLARMPPKSLDPYSHIEFQLLQYNVTIYVVTYTHENHLLYRITHLENPPSKSL